MVNKENVRKWVAALRSGEYEQTKGALRRDGGDSGRVGYCCLGVACDVSGLGEWVQASEDGEQEYGYDILAYRVEGYAENDINYDAEAVMHPAVRDWLGVPDLNPDVYQPGSDGGAYPLAYFNDTESLDFAAIADLIEHEFLSEDVTA